MILNYIIKILGRLADKVYGVRVRYYNQNIKMQIGMGEKVIQYPYHITCPDNIIADDYVNIGVGSTIMNSRAKLRIKQHFVSGPGLTVVTGDHMPVIGRFLDTVSNEDKDKLDVLHEYDQDVVIEEDVWCGANVTILKGVTIGRGCIIASGAIVTKSIPPYCVAGGVPAKVLKVRWNIQQIKEHEKYLYPEKDRLSQQKLEAITNNFSIKE